jgi:predicted MFS family arabinose efflux permease
LVRERYGSFEVAGTVVAAYTAAVVVSGVVVGRRASRPRFPRLLVGLALLQAVLLAGVVGLAGQRAPAALVVAAAALLGLAVPPAGVVVRSRWAGRLDDREPLNLALFLESAFDEAVFVLGPLLVGLLGVAVGPEVALLTAGTLTTLGCLGLAAIPAGAPAHDNPAGRHTPSFALARLCAGVVTLGVAFAAVQVAAFAVTRDAGVPQAAGPVLTAFSMVSLVAGVMAGRRQAVPLLRAGLAVLAVALVPAAVAATTATGLALLLLPAACAASPSVALAFAQAAALSTEKHRPAAFAWVGAALGVGLAVGHASLGAVAEHQGASAALLAGAVAVGLGALLAPGYGLADDWPTPAHSSCGVGVAPAGAGPRD